MEVRPGRNRDQIPRWHLLLERDRVVPRQQIHVLQRLVRTDHPEVRLRRRGGNHQQRYRLCGLQETRRFKVPKDGERAPGEVLGWRTGWVGDGYGGEHLDRTLEQGVCVVFQARRRVDPGGESE